MVIEENLLLICHEDLVFSKHFPRFVFGLYSQASTLKTKHDEYKKMD